MMEDRALDDEGLDTLAARLGVTDRHLRRAFGAEFGVSPVEYRADAAAAARQAPADRHRPAGYRGGLRQRLRQPAALQRAVQASATAYNPSAAAPHVRGAATAAPATMLELRTELPPALRLARRERVPRRARHRTASKRWTSALLSPHRARRDRRRRAPRAGSRSTMSPGKPALRVRSPRRSRRAVPPVLSRVKALMDLACHPAEVARALGALARAQPGSARARRVRRLRGGGARDPRAAGYRRCRAHDRRPLRCGVRRTDRNAVCISDDACSPRPTRIAALRYEPHRARSACPARAPATVLALARAVARRPSRPRAERGYRGDAGPRCARCPAWANGPRSTSRCARSPGRTHFRTPTWA